MNLSGRKNYSGVTAGGLIAFPLLPAAEPTQHNTFRKQLWPRIIFVSMVLLPNRLVNPTTQEQPSGSMGLTEDRLKASIIQHHFVEANRTNPGHLLNTQPSKCAM